MFRHFLIKFFFLLILPMFCTGNNNLNEKIAKLKSEIFEIAISFTDMNVEFNSKMWNLFGKQIANKENFMKIFDEINKKKHVILAELNEKFELKMVNLKTKLAVENLKTNLSLLHDPFLMVNPAGISEILKSEYSILQKLGITMHGGKETGEISKSGSAKENENKNEIGQKMVELEKLVNSLTEQIQILVNSELNGLGFGEMTWQYWLLFLMRKLVEDGLRLLNGLLQIEAEPSDLAYGQIGRHLVWLKGKIGIEQEIWMNIAIDQEMAKKLAKMKENEIQIEIFKELAGRKFSDKLKLDNMEWKLFVLIAKILDLYYSEKEKREQKLKRKRIDGNNSDSNGSKTQRLSENENKLEKILENAPIYDSQNKFPQDFKNILLTNGLIDSVKSIEPLVEHQKFMVEKLGDDYTDEWKNGEIIFTEFEKKITKTGDLLEEAIKGIMEEKEMRQILLPKAIEELEKIINKLRVFLYGDKTKLLVKKDSTMLKNKLESILEILGNNKYGHIWSEKFDVKGNLQKLGEMAILDGRLGILQRLIVEFEYFLTRGQKLWKKFEKNTIGNVGQSKRMKQKNVVGPTNSENLEVIKEILDEEMKILQWMKKLEEIGLEAIEMHISIQEWHLKSRDPRLRENAKEKFKKFMKFFNSKMKIVGAGAGWENIITDLEEMNENGVRMEYLERKKLESAINKLVIFFR